MSSEFTLQSVGTERPKAIIIDPSGTRPGESIVASACLRRMRYEPVFCAPQVDPGEDLPWPGGGLGSLIGLLRTRIALSRLEVAALLCLAPAGELGVGAKLLPGRLLRFQEEGERNLLVEGFAVAGAARVRDVLPGEEEGEETAPADHGPVTIGVPGVEEGEVAAVEALFARVADTAALFREASITFALLPPVPKSVRESLVKSGLEGVVTRVEEPGSARAYYRTVLGFDALLHLTRSSVYWAAATNRPLVCSTKLRPPAELRSLSVYYSGFRVEEIAEKIVADQVDRRSLSYVRISPHIFVDAGEAALREVCTRIRGALD
ncbi:MAG: hypothetical protein ACLFP6_11740 [Spirochaetaceae bacterium]